MSSVSDVGGLQSEGGTVGQGAPLNAQEYQLLQRLLSDPFSLPMQFKTWLVSYLETSDMNLPISAVNGLVQILGVSGVGSGTLGIFPAGVILPYGGTTAPDGSLMCDGQAYLQSAYPRLYSAIGNNYGSAPANSFLVPDLRDRVPVGVGQHLDHNAVAKSDGLAEGQRRVKHAHDVEGWSSIGVQQWNDTADGDVVNMPFGGETNEMLPHDHHPADGQPFPVGGPAYLTINFVIIA